MRGRRGSLWSAASNGAIDAFEQLGPTFVKLGQIIASSPGLFPTPLAVAAQRCLDEMAPFDARTAREMIRKDLGRSPSAIFKRFDEVPLSAASIGQVHACVLPDGREAVIKLQRPNVRQADDDRSADLVPAGQDPRAALSPSPATPTPWR